MITEQTAGEYRRETGGGTPARNRNILIVDDDRLVCWALERLISARDFFITAVSTGEEALSALSRIPFALAFLDVHLPDANGLELMPEMKRMSPETRVAVMTADYSEALRQRALKEGAAYFFGKPFSVSEIREILDSVPEPAENGRP